MAVKIRLSRTGRTNRPNYRVVAIDEHKKRDGRFIEILGSFDPLVKQGGVVLKKDRIDYWISQGAKPSDTVARLIKKS